MGGERCGEQRCERRHRPVHQSGEARLHILQHEDAPPGLVLVGAHARAEDLVGQLGRDFLVALFRLGEITEQPADADILGLLGGLDVEPLGLEFHGPDLLADGVERQILGQPDRTAAQKPLDIVPADRRQIAGRSAVRTFRAAGGDGPSPPRPSPRRSSPNPDSAPPGPRRRSCRCGCLPLPRRSQPPALRARSNRRKFFIREALHYQFRMILKWYNSRFGVGQMTVCHRERLRHRGGMELLRGLHSSSALQGSRGRSMDKVKYRLNDPRLAPRRTKLEIPGWAGKREPRTDGSQRAGLALRSVFGGRAIRDRAVLPL